MENKFLQKLFIVELSEFIKDLPVPSNLDIKPVFEKNEENEQTPSLEGYEKTLKEYPLLDRQQCKDFINNFINNEILSTVKLKPLNFDLFHSYYGKECENKIMVDLLVSKLTQIKEHYEVQKLIKEKDSFFSAFSFENYTRFLLHFMDLFNNPLLNDYEYDPIYIVELK